MNVLVTGATAGFGAAIARRFVKSHVNINVISMMPMQQAFSPFAVKRD